MADEPTRATLLLRDASAGDGQAEAELLPLVWQQLRAIAGRFMADERQDHTLQPTALVHEAYLRLFDRSGVPAGDRQVFLGLAARAMRRVLIDHARARRAERRGGGRWGRVQLDGVDLGAGGAGADVLVVHELLERFAQVDARASRVVELRFFGGLTKAEAAAVLGLSERTVDNDWFAARAWLTRELERGDGG